MLTEEQLLKLKESYAAWFEPGDDLDLSEVADDVIKLVDEVLATRVQLAATRQKLEATETVLAAGMWKNAGQCPLCAADVSRAIYDPLNDVKVTYCLHCETAVLWMPDTVQAERDAGRGYAWGDCAVRSGGEPD